VWPDCTLRHGLLAKRHKADVQATSTMPAPDPVVSGSLGAYAIPPQATDGLVAQDIDLPVPC